MRHQPNRDVAPILLRREQSKLSARAPRRSRHFRCLRQNLLDNPQLAIGLRQRRSPRTPIIKNERTFIHLGKKACPHNLIRPNASSG